MIDAYMDIAWERIELAIQFSAAFVDRMLMPLHPVGPTALIFCLALIAVAITKILGRVFQTQRYLELKKEFQHWYDLRQQALTCDDPKKGKIASRNGAHRLQS